MKHYVLGFLFGYNEKRVLLIRKTHPEWQAGRYNGIGGHIEAGETALEAMQREGLEEAGVLPQWQYKGYMQGPGWECSVFAAHSFNADFDGARTCTEEVVDVWQVSTLHSKQVLPNVRALVALCLCSDTFKFTLQY